MTNASSVLSSLGLSLCPCPAAPDSPVVVTFSMDKPSDGMLETGGFRDSTCCGNGNGSGGGSGGVSCGIDASRATPTEEPYRGDEVGGTSNMMPKFSVDDHDAQLTKEGNATADSSLKDGGDDDDEEEKKCDDDYMTTKRAVSACNSCDGGGGIKSAATADTQELSVGGSDRPEGEDEQDDVDDVQAATQEGIDEHSKAGLNRESSSTSAVPSLRMDPIHHPSEHERWAEAAPGFDLSGSWSIIVSDAFKSEYGKYLSGLGFGYVVRNVALQVIGRTSEYTLQSENGRSLLIKGSNPRGVWERTLVSSGYPELDTRSHLADGTDYHHFRVPVVTADQEQVEAEAWWEREGTAHRSWLRGGKKYGGGDFESLRYLEDEGKVLVCESYFHPADQKKSSCAVTWRFRRVES